MKAHKVFLYERPVFLDGSFRFGWVAFQHGDTSSKGNELILILKFRKFARSNPIDDRKP